MTGLPSMSAALQDAVRILLPGLAPLAEAVCPREEPTRIGDLRPIIGTCLPAHPAAPMTAMRVVSVIP
jgi:hypothetical protein